MADQPTVFTDKGKVELLKSIRSVIANYGIEAEDIHNLAELILLAIDRKMLKMAHASGMKGSPHEPEEPPEGDGTPIEAVAIA